MSKLILHNLVDCSVTEIYDVDLKTVTPRRIIEAALEFGVLINDPNMVGVYKIINKGHNWPIIDEEDVALANLGFVDGDTLIVVGKPTD